MNKPGLTARRQKVLGSAYRLFYDEPLELVRGEGVWLYDAQGKAYLDVYNNVPHVGHCHPVVVDAVSRQLATLNTHTRYLHPGLIAYAERLLQRLPADIDKAMFACSGTEAVELALRLARASTGGDGIICTRHAYHGNSWAVSQISPETPGADRATHVVTVEVPGLLHRKAESDQAPVKQFVTGIEQALELLSKRGIKLAAFIVDTVMSSEGINRFPEGLSAAVKRVKNAGGLFIADEVQMGFGRPGRYFWGFEWQGVAPDIVTMGKPMGNGYPVSAVATRSEILDAFSGRAGYFNTFGGSPVAAAAANAVLDVIEDEALQDNAMLTGRHLRSGLADLAAEFECIADIRGTGLFNGVELVTDRQSMEPATGLAHRLVNELKQRGVLVGRTGPGENIVKLRPPMVFSRDDADLLLGAFSGALETQLKNRKR
ncbi:MAG: aminotransferase class III-fold pyridoxal phosphate-dependent enzyme [Xanthomonadales bacterium]|nr:aminotransferase class III-fold pyridoxal phosphate-dependent enzyme [Xanthomonadales bacterium]